MSCAMEKNTNPVYLEAASTQQGGGIDAVKAEMLKLTFAADDGMTLPYRLHTPKTIEAGKTYPLVIHFHGAGSRGDDNALQLRLGVGELLQSAEDAGEEIFLLAPQCPENCQWVDVPWGDTEHRMPSRPSKPMACAIGILEHVLTEYPIDRTRLYASGISMGGFGAWDLIQRFADRFAGAFIVCGGGDKTLAHTLTKTAIWLFHGSDDTVVKTSRSQEMAEVLRTAGGKCHYTEYPGVKHDSWIQAYNDASALHQLFCHKK